MSIIGNLLTCASLITVDGATVRCDGQLLRPMGPGRPGVDGFDTPETRTPECNNEARVAGLAMARMAELIETPGLKIIDSAEIDDFGRPLVWLMLPGGETIGEVLLREGLAQPWPNVGNVWCEE